MSRAADLVRALDGFHASPALVEKTPAERGEEVFRLVCEKPDPSAYVRELMDYNLCDLLAWLVARKQFTGVPADIWAIAMGEAATRYVKLTA